MRIIMVDRNRIVQSFVDREHVVQISEWICHTEEDKNLRRFTGKDK